MLKDDFSTYIRDITKRYSKLTASEERKLGRRIRKGDEEAVNKLVESNLPLVIAYAKRFYSSGMDLSDIIQEGNIGLIGAARSFNYRRGVRFSTHATWRILAKIRRALENQSRLVKIPSNFYHLHIKLKKKYEKAKELGKEFKEKIPETIARHGEYNPENFNFKNIDLSTLKLFQTDEALLNLMEDRDEIEIYMEPLTNREREVICRYFGVYDVPKQNINVVAKSLGLSHNMIDSILARALWKMSVAALETRRRRTTPKQSYLYTQTPPL